MNPPVHIELFGGLRVRSSKGPGVEFPRQQTGALLAFLALYPRRSHTREELMALIWPDDEEESARHKLRQSLYALRRHLDCGQDSEESCLAATRDTIGLASHRIVTDLARFEDAIKSAAAISELDSRIGLLTEAISLYRGELLAGFYQDEFVLERGRLAEMYRSALHDLTRALEQAGDLGNAIEIGRRTVALDPLIEEAHCNLMRLYAAAGQPSAVLRQYEELSNTLREQLDEEPSDQTRLMMESLRSQAQEIVASDRNLTISRLAALTNPGEIMPPRHLRFRFAAIVPVIAVTIIIFLAMRKPETTSKVTIRPMPAPRLSLAVLPFKSMSPGQDIDYLSDGICEQVTNTLAQSSELRVAARTSAFQFKNTELDAREIGRKLNVAFLLEGSVRRSGSRVRVTAQLINAQNGYQVWTDSYDKHQRDFIQIQDEVAKSMSEALKIRISAPESSLARKPQNPRAYDYFLKGQYHYTRRTLNDTIASIACFERVIQLDPQFAPAYSGLANAYFRRYILENAVSLNPIQKAFAAAKKAIQLDDRLPDAHASMGNLYHRYQADWRASERELRRALELDPNHFDALRWYGSMLFSSARAEMAIPYMLKVRERDPLNVSISVELAHAYLYSRRFDEAVAEFDRALDLQPGNPSALNGKWATLECAGRFREAAETMARWFDALPGGAPHATGTREAFRAGGMKAVYEYGVRYASREYEAGRHNGAAFISAWYLTRLGRISQALDWLERGYRVDHSLPAILFDIRFDSLRSHPRFIRLFKLYGGEDIPRS